MIPAVDEMLTILAEFEQRSNLLQCFMLRNMLVRFTDKARFHSSKDISERHLRTIIPALFTTISRWPNSFSILLTVLIHWDSSVTSRYENQTGMPWLCRVFAKEFPDSTSMSAMITVAPLFASSLTMLAPSPRAPPVTRAVNPYRSSLIGIPPLLLSYIKRAGCETSSSNISMNP